MKSSANNNGNPLFAGNNRREGRFAWPNFSMVIHRMLATLFRNKHENVRSLPQLSPPIAFGEIPGRPRTIIWRNILAAVK